MYRTGILAVLCVITVATDLYWVFAATLVAFVVYSAACFGIGICLSNRPPIWPPMGIFVILRWLHQWVFCLWCYTMDYHCWINCAVVAAANVGDANRIETFVNLGCKVDVPFYFPDESFSTSALLLAVEGRHHAAVRSLLHARADPNLRFRWQYLPLGAAIHLNDVPIARLLLEHGAQDWGWTVQAKHKAMIDLLEEPHRVARAPEAPPPPFVHHSI